MIIPGHIFSSKTEPGKYRIVVFWVDPVQNLFKSEFLEAIPHPTDRIVYIAGDGRRYQPGKAKKSGLNGNRQAGGRDCFLENGGIEFTGSLSLPIGVR